MWHTNHNSRKISPAFCLRGQFQSGSKTLKNAFQTSYSSKHYFLTFESLKKVKFHFLEEVDDQGPVSC